MEIRALGMQEFNWAWSRMRQFTDARAADTQDELWVIEHPPVFTQGVAGKPEHLLANPENIPVIRTDRGGQITYHGPGQAVVYCLFDLRRQDYGVREMVRRIEGGVIALLAKHNVVAQGRIDAPGVYVDSRKIASLGLKVRNGCTYHGVALNVNMDMRPFHHINPCGLQDMQMAQCAEFGIADSASQAGLALALELSKALSQ